MTDNASPVTAPSEESDDAIDAAMDESNVRTQYDSSDENPPGIPAEIVIGSEDANAAPVVTSSRHKQPMRRQNSLRRRLGASSLLRMMQRVLVKMTVPRRILATLQIRKTTTLKVSDPSRNKKMMVMAMKLG
jgi:hypothetical protein